MGSLTAATAQYNGNIAAVKWKNGSSSSDPLQAYGFTYDALDRLRDANYADGSALTGNKGRFKESIGEYDLNGNIKKLNRSGINIVNNVTTYYPKLDSLTYTYTGNQVMKIVDSGEKNFGFIDNTLTTDDYAYDKNGNLTKDNNKGYTAIEYNYLNLPKEVRKDANNKAQYIYDAAGNKLKAIHTLAGVATPRWYMGIMEYDNNKRLKLIHTDKGIVDVGGSGSSYTFTPEYHIKDHLGSVRAAFKPNGSSPTLTQSFNYYPFGAISEANWGTAKNLYTFSGKELVNDNIGGNKLDQYDFSARYYCGWTGRWWVLDPLSELGRRWSGYNYAFNNPLKYTDPDGRWPGLAAAAVGGGLDYLTQVATNYIVEGKTGTEAWTDVSGKSILISAGTSVAGVGLASKAKQLANLYKLGKASTAIVTGTANVVIDGSMSAVNQAINNGEVDMKSVAIDVVASQAAGGAARSATKSAAQNSPQGRVLQNQADRAQRVTSGSAPREARVRNAEAATQRAENYGDGRAAAAGTAASRTGSEIIKLTLPDDENK